MLPTVSLLSLAGVVTVSSGSEAATAEGLVKLADVSAMSAELGSALSQERTAAALILMNGTDRDMAAGQYRGAAAQTDLVASTWRQRVVGAGEAPAATAAALDRASSLVDGLADIRSAVRSADNAVLSVLVLRYRLIIAGLLDVQLSLIVAGAPSQIADRLRALAALSQAAESAGLQQMAVLRAIAGGRLTAASAGQIAAARSGYVEAMQVVDTAGDRSWRVHLDQALSGEDILAAQRLEGVVSRTETGEPVPVVAADWAGSQQVRQLLLRKVSRGAEAEVAAQLREWRDQRLRLAIWTGGVVGVVLLVAVWLGWFLARRMSRSLESLRATALAIAKTGLPLAVEGLAGRDDLALMSAQAAAEQAATPLVLRGHDEIAQVARSFNAVQLTALRLAAEQAQARMRVAAMFLTVGLAQQRKLVQLVSKLDVLERDEEDPDRLAALFDVDHQIAMMSRGNARLMLLAGAPPGPSRTVAASLDDVLMAAMSKVDGYPRVERTDVDSSVLVRAEAIDGMVLALTELLDNGCVYSLPESKVLVSAQRVGDRVVVCVRDDGVGMTPADLSGANALLAKGGKLSVPALRSMGLAVVARVATLHRLQVRLIANDVRGITAELILPASVVQMPAVTGQRVLTRSVMALRQERRVDQPDPEGRWPQVIDGSEFAVSESGLPVRQRSTAVAQKPPAKQIQRRDPALRARELSAMQAAIRAAQSARGSTRTRWEE